MSLFGRGNSLQREMDQMQQELHIEATQALFTSLSKICFRKCVPHFVEEELAVGELSCVDRCVSKYMKTNVKVGAIMNEFQQAEALAQGMQPPQ